MDNFRSKTIYFLAVFLFVLILSCGSATAATINVDPGPDAIKKAISTASAGDTLNLSEGTYKEYDLNVDKNLTITGPETTGTPTVVIDALEEGRVFNIPANTNVNLQYLTIQSGDATKDTDTTNGGAIQNFGTLSIKNCQITKNTATDGGGIYNSGTCNISDSVVSSNTADYGGGIDNYEGTCNVSDSAVTDNSANYYGGGGIYNSGAMSVYSSAVTGNSAYYYGGGICNVGTMSVYSSAVTGNSVDIYGGGISNSHGTCTVIGSNINGNTAANDNFAANGGGIWNYYGNCIVIGSNIDVNTATNNGGGICNEFGICTVIGSNIDGNTAANGGGIYNNNECTVIGSAINGNTVSIWGGGIYNGNNDCTVIGSSVNGNNAGNGGGIYNGNGTCTVTDSTINDNIAGSGGGILNNGTMGVSGSAVIGNIATNGGGIWNNNFMTVSKCDFAYNNASYGKAIFNRDGDFLSRIVQYCRFYDPGSGYEIYCDSGSVDAQFNWWCSDADPSAKVSGGVDVSPWLVLTITANPSLLAKNGTSDVTVDLLHDSDGGLHDIGPNGIFVTFTTNLGNITPIIFTVDGVANATFTGGSTDGVANINAVMDGQVIRTMVTVDVTAPTITSTDPVNGATNVAKDKVIIVTFSEDVVMGTGWIELVDSNGTPVDVNMSINGN
ncbi:MAG: Ig-like domain-containing protein, partial [Methanothermobacter sp.]